MPGSFPRISFLTAFALATLGAPLAVPTDLAAQSRTTSAVRGVIVHDDSIPAPNVAVRIHHLETGLERGVITDADGRYLVRLLPPGGPYRMSFTAFGFRPEQRDSLYLLVGETDRFDLDLQPLALEVEGLEVAIERAAIFDPGMVGQATYLDERTVESVPILSRDLMDLATLSPQVTVTEGGGVSVAGQNDRYNAVLVDGISAKDLFGLTSGTVPGAQAGAKLVPFDAIAQYEVLVAPFDVRLTGFTGGVLNAVTRTGTNDWRVRASAVHRTEALLGDLTLPLGRVEGVGVDRSLFGLSIGGPILEDRLHFFVTGEVERRVEPPDGFNLDRVDPRLVRLTSESVSAFRDVFRTSYGEDPGEAGPYPLGQRAVNLFGRLDWNFGRHRVTIRNIHARGERDDDPNRAPFRAYELSSNAVFREAFHNLVSAQLYTDLGGGRGNELSLSVQRARDRSEPAVSWPQADVDLRSSIGANSFGRAVRVGSQYHAQESDLEQNTMRLVESLVLPHQKSTYTLGVTAAFYDFRRRDLPGSGGAWSFASLADLEANVPSRFERTVLGPGEDPVLDFQVTEVGAFVQNQIASGDGLTMHFGFRADVPFIHGRPNDNPVTEELGYKSTHMPSRSVMISPRWGFNWQSDGERRTQLRGGAGFFSGELPYVWLADAFRYDGIRTVTLVCEGRRTTEGATGTAPPFTTGALPDECLGGETREIRNAVLFHRRFKYPRYIKMAMAVDREINDWLSGSLDFLLNYARNQVSVVERNVRRHRDGDPPILSRDGYGEDRTHYGYANRRGYTPLRIDDRLDQVLLIENAGEDQAISATLELRARLLDRMNARFAYTSSRSKDRMSLVSPDITTNYGLNAIAQAVTRPALAASNFDRPHRFIVTLFGNPFPASPDTEVSLLYTGQSGLPYSYVYEGDVNGDGWPGPGAAFDRGNDLLYVPDPVTELSAPISTHTLLASALRTDPCLRRYRGRIMPRNACRTPWQHRLDLRLAQRLRLAGAEIRFEGDLINVLNLLDSRWGRVLTVPAVVPILEPYDRVPSSPLGGGQLISRWAGPVIPGADGTPEAALPWTVVSPESQWQAQFGVRVTFGGR